MLSIIISQDIYTDVMSYLDPPLPRSRPPRPRKLFARLSPRLPKSPLPLLRKLLLPPLPPPPRGGPPIPKGGGPFPGPLDIPGSGGLEE